MPIDAIARDTMRPHKIANETAHDPRHAARRAVCLTALLVLAACGGGGGGGGGDSDTAQASSIAGVSVSADITCDLADFQAELLRRVNEVRNTGTTCAAEYDGVGNLLHAAQTYPAGAVALTWDAKLLQAATGHSTDMAKNNYFSHTSQDGRTLSQRIDATGYRWSALAENIAAGYPSVQEVTDGWMTSPGHCRNIMNPNLTQMAVACVQATGAKYSNYWTMDLGRPAP
jgi:uncharacterized protein YkwD